MDRTSALSFVRAEDAERRLRDLVRSRVDTTREVVFEPISVRSPKRARTSRASPLY
jgi:hypothetical protein